jgi:sec-independent protein translocase protein TatA
MASLSIWHWLIVLCVVLLIFGAKQPSSAANSIATAIVNFRQAIQNSKSRTFYLWFVVAIALVLCLLFAAEGLTAR